MRLEEFLRKNYRDIERVRSFLLYNRYNRVCITTHKNADPDAIASALTLKHYLENNGYHVYIALPEGLNAAAKNLLYNIGFNNVFLDASIIEKLNHIIGFYIIVDTSSPTQLGEILRFVSRNKYIVLDHHEPGPLLKDSLISIVFSNLVSTSEIIYTLLRDSWWISPVDSMLLLAGILYDSRRFYYIDDIVFDVVNELISINKTDYYNVLKLLQKPMDYSEKIARLKAAQRLRFENISGFIVATTHVSAYEGSVARALIDLGADIVFVASSNKDQLRIVARATKQFVESTGISLGRDLMPLIASKINGAGGGHDTAGTAEGRGEPSYGLVIAIKILKRVLKTKFSSR